MMLAQRLLPHCEVQYNPCNFISGLTLRRAEAKDIASLCKQELPTLSAAEMSTLNGRAIQVLPTQNSRQGRLTLRPPGC